MKRTVNVHEFRDAFREYGRSDSFSYEGQGALFDYLEQLEEDTGEEMELDVIGLCCDFSEYETALEAAQEYGFEPDEIDCENCGGDGELDCDLCDTNGCISCAQTGYATCKICGGTGTVKNEDQDELNEQALEWLQDRATVIEFDGGVIIQGF